MINNGADGSLTTLLPGHASQAVARGYNVLIFDGPGQQSLLFERNIPFRPDWEHVVTPIVDLLLARPDVDPDRLALYGVSQGGYWVPRTLAFEHRFAAAIADGGVVDVGATWRSKLPSLSPRSSTMVNVTSSTHCSTSPIRTQRRVITWRAKPYGQPTLYDTFVEVQRYRITPELAHQIDTPLMIANPDQEQFFTGQPARLFDMLPGRQAPRPLRRRGWRCRPLSAHGPGPRRPTLLRLPRRHPRPDQRPNRADPDHTPMNLTDSTGAPRPVDERRFAGRVALVTGGSSGIGWAISQLLATNGATVAVVASGSQTKAIEAADRISETGGAAHPFVADVTDTNAVNDLMHDISDTLGASPSIVVNAAGLWRPTPLDEMDDHALDRLVDTNLKGTIRVTAAAAPHMIARGFGHIVNISSVAGSNPSPGYSVYAATKAAVNAFARAARARTRPARDRRQRHRPRQHRNGHERTHPNRLRIRRTTRLDTAHHTQPTPIHPTPRDRPGRPHAHRRPHQRLPRGRHLHRRRTKRRTNAMSPTRPQVSPTAGMAWQGCGYQTPGTSRLVRPR